MEMDNRHDEAATEKSPGLVKTALSKLFETLLNQAVQLDDMQGQALAPCDEKVVQLTFTDLGQTFFLIYQIDADNPGTFSVQNHLMGAPDTHIQLTSLDWIGRQPNYEASGDEALAADFIQGVQSLNIDWEEQLSKITGDLVAFKIGSTVREGRKSVESAKRKAGDTLREYLQFEIELLPTAPQIQRFKRDVQHTTQAVDALEKRLQALSDNLS
jgi:ubiquinone biosynthesis protein UbiJ